MMKRLVAGLIVLALVWLTFTGHARAAATEWAGDAHSKARLVTASQHWC